MKTPYLLAGCVFLGMHARGNIWHRFDNFPILWFFQMVWKHNRQTNSVVIRVYCVTCVCVYCEPARLGSLLKYLVSVVPVFTEISTWQAEAMLWPILQGKSNPGITFFSCSVGSSVRHRSTRLARAKEREICWRETTGFVASRSQSSKGNIRAPWWKWRTVTAYAVSLGQEEVMQAVCNLCPWARACLARMGAAFEVDLLTPDGPSPVQSHAINSDHYRIRVTCCVLMPHEEV